jgi:rRNA-processing protein FCF1
MKRSVNLAIPEDVAQQLERLAERESRRSRDEATLLLVYAVRRAALDFAERANCTTLESSSARPLSWSSTGSS